MKKLMLVLLFCNIVVIGWGGYFLTKCYRSRVAKGDLSSLRTADKIIIKNLTDATELYLEKHARSGKWEISCGDIKWMVNMESLRKFYDKLVVLWPEAASDLSEKQYEVTIISGRASKTLKLSTNMLLRMLDSRCGVADEQKLSLDALMVHFFNEKIFSYVRGVCKIFKLQRDGKEFVFSRRNGRWHLDNFSGNLSASNEMITKFFHAIFSLETTDVGPKYSLSRAPDVTITLYGENSVERVSFAVSDDGRSLASNDAVDAWFGVERACVEKVLRLVDRLLEFPIFLNIAHDNIDIVLYGSGEHFNFHNAHAQDKWQFTYSQNGNFAVKELHKSDVEPVINVLCGTRSKCVLLDIPTEQKLFTITFDKMSKNEQIFHFYLYGDRLFLENETTSTHVEIASSFTAQFFHILRSYLTNGSATNDSIRLLH